jgi:predicted AlkP superfamily pyrophosphatase or phosphodiesterase
MRTFLRCGSMALLLLAGGCALATPAATGRHVVLIVIDGLRPDAITAASAANLGKLVAGGATTLTARAVEIPETLPGHVTMVTGLPPGVHGITWDDDRGGTMSWPTIYTRVHDAGGHSALYQGKSKLTLLAAPGTAEVVRGPDADKKNRDRGAGMVLARAFAQDFAQQPFAFALVHLREPDYAGHKSGWMSPDYLDAVRADDAAVGVILDAIAASPAAESTLVLLTADHGGEGISHLKSDGDTTWQIPFICKVPGAGGTPIREPVTLLDVAPTVLAYLRLPALPQGTGHALRECVPR